MGLQGSCGLVGLKWAQVGYSTTVLFYFLFFGCIGSLLLRGGFSLVVVSGDYSLLQFAGFSLQWLLLLQSMGSKHASFSSCGSRAPEHRLSSCGSQT